jgi:hypothetical protein
LEDSPCSCIRSSDPWDEISDEEAGGGEDPVREGGGVEAVLDEDEDPLA